MGAASDKIAQHKVFLCSGAPTYQSEFTVNAAGVPTSNGTNALASKPIAVVAVRSLHMWSIKKADGFTHKEYIQTCFDAGYYPLDQVQAYELNKNNSPVETTT